MIGYSPLPTKARGDPLGQDFLQTLINNQIANVILQIQEHNGDGSHNTLSIPKAVGRITNTAGVYSVDGTSQGITSVAKNAVGDVTVTLDNTQFTGTTDTLVVCLAAALNSAPAQPSYQVLTANTVECFLSVAGGVATDMSFDIAAWTLPLINSAVIQSFMQSINPGKPLWFDDGSGKGLNAFIFNQGTLQNNLLNKHLGTGGHNSHDVAREWAYVSLDASGTPVPYFTFSSAGIQSVSRTGPGAFTVTFLAGRLANPSDMYAVVTDQAITDGVNTTRAPPANPLQDWWIINASQPDATHLNIVTNSKPFGGAIAQNDPAGFAFVVFSSQSLAASNNAWSKIPKVVQDSPWGFQDVNQAAINEREIFNAWTAEHFDFTVTSQNFGQHNTFGVPKFIARYLVNAGSKSFDTKFSSFNPKYYGISYVSTGVYFISYALGKNSIVIPTIEGNNPNLRMQPRLTAVSGAPPSPNGVYLFCTNTAPSEVLTDPAGFSVQIYSS